MIKRAIIALNGIYTDAFFYQSLINQTDLLVVADGAANFLKKQGIKPDVLVGDLDSIQPDLLASYQQDGIEIHQYPKDKDQTDGEIALDYVIQKQMEEVIIIGAWGDRIDHSLGNLMLLYQGHLSNIEVSIRTESHTISILGPGRNELSISTGTTVSFVPIYGPVKDLSLEGFLYPLQEATIERGSCQTISNETTANKQIVTIGSGYLCQIVIDQDKQKSLT